MACKTWTDMVMHFPPLTGSCGFINTSQWGQNTSTTGPKSAISFLPSTAVSQSFNHRREELVRKTALAALWTEIIQCALETLSSLVYACGQKYVLTGVYTNALNNK